MKTALLHKLAEIGPRRGTSEQKAAKIIRNQLKKSNIPFTRQVFSTTIPNVLKAELFADNKTIPCVGASYTSGTIDKSSPILNSFTANADTSSIIFNPVHLGICMHIYQKNPSVAINRDSVAQLIMAKDIHGEVVVENQTYETENVLVGNMKNPKKVVFAHYDSIVGQGAIDNAGSVEVVFQTLTSTPNLLNDTLFVFAGSEEESVSSPDGFYGFEIFDNENPHILENVKGIIILDGVGLTKPSFTTDNLGWVFGISRLESCKHKIKWMWNDQSEVMKYYHSSLDTLNLVDASLIQESVTLLIDELSYDE